MPIPKIIHYCWFGGNPIPEKYKRYMESWKKFCPGYDIMEWNERNYDIMQNKYICEAYKSKKWGFVTDFVRLDVVYQNGGIYFDTDVELIKPLDTLLSNKAFMGFEDGEHVNTGLGFGAEKNLGIIRELRDHYLNIKFLNEDGTYNLTVCPVHQTNCLLKHGLVQNNAKQIVEGIAIYPSEYFSPKRWDTGKTRITANTFSIHHFSASWYSNEQRVHREIVQKLCRIFSYRIASKFANFVVALKYKGLEYIISKFYKK
ncbi:MAG: glycosyl transferase [Eubacterium sp.]|jgi:hypothetical protein|nr:glycosyl transferase [Eubacterium sp.]